MPLARADMATWHFRTVIQGTPTPALPLSCQDTPAQGWAVVVAMAQAQQLLLVQEKNQGGTGLSTAGMIISAASRNFTSITSTSQKLSWWRKYLNIYISWTLKTCTARVHFSLSKHTLADPALSANALMLQGRTEMVMDGTGYKAKKQPLSVAPLINPMVFLCNLTNFKFSSQLNNLTFGMRDCFCASLFWKVTYMGFGIFGDPKPSQMCQTRSSNQTRYCNQANYYSLLDISQAGNWLYLTFDSQSEYLRSFNNLNQSTLFVKLFKFTPKPRIMLNCLLFIINKNT